MPPILKVAPFDTVSVPPAADLFAVKEDKSKVPEATVRLLAVVTLLVSVAVPPVLFIVKLLNAVAVVPPMLWSPVPSNVTVAVPLVNAALFVKLPPMSKLKLPEARVPPPISKLPFTVMAAPRVAVRPVTVTVRLLYIGIAAGSVELPPVAFQNIVPVPGTNVVFVLVQEVRIRRVPPFVIFIVPAPAVPFTTVTTLSVFVPPTGH